MNTDGLIESPFVRGENGRSTVSVAREAGAYETTRVALERIDLSPASGARVLVKPNVGREAEPETGVNTHPDVVAAAIDALRDAGADVVVGESPISGVDAMAAFEKSGVAAVARERKCELVDMDKVPAVEVELPEGHAISELQVCRAVLEADLVVSVPVMKVHMHTGATIAVKNMKGCLWRRSKIKLHMLPEMPNGEKSLNVAIADMSAALRPQLSIVDGIVGMEGLGPGAGAPKELGVVVAGVDAFAVDAVSCELMGVSATEVPHLRIGASRGLGTIDLDTIDVVPTGWREWIDPFERPPSNLTFEFPNIRVHDKQSCSACQSTLLMLLREHGDELREYFPADEPIDIAIGKGHTSVPEGTLCVGNCTARHKGRGCFVPGCPPVCSQILRTVKGEA